MSRTPQALRTYARDAAGAFSLAPLEVVLGLLVAVTFSVAIRGEEMEWWWRIATSAALALPLLFGLSVLRARRVIGAATRWAVSAAVLAAAAAYGTWVMDPDRSTEAWRFIALLGAAVMAVSLVPVVGVRGDEERRREFWRFDALLLARLVSVVAYGIALFAALAGAVAAVSSLFELKTPEHLYQDLMGAVFFALVPWVVAGGIGELVAVPVGEGSRAPRALRLLGRYLYAPVLAVYLAILLAYAVKVLVTGEMPRNLLSPIILLAGLFGFLGSLFLEPLNRDPEHTGVARLVRVLPALFLVLLPLATWAVWVRRDQYGWTEFRYLRFALLIALGVLSLLGVYRLVRRREPLLLAVPVVLGATLLLGAVGPWSASAVSRRSQEARLRAGLREAGLLADGRLARPLLPAEPPVDITDPGRKLVSRELHDRITGSVSYLYEAHGPEALRAVLGAQVNGFGDGWRLANALPVRPGCDPDEAVQSVTASLPDGAPVPGILGGTLHRVERAGGRDAPERDAGRPIQFQIGETELRVHAVGRERWTARVDLRPLIARLSSGGRGDCGPEPRFGSDQLSPVGALFSLTDEAGRPRGQLLLTTVAIGRRSPDPRASATEGPFRLEHASGLVLVVE